MILTAGASALIVLSQTGHKIILSQYEKDFILICLFLALLAEAASYLVGVIVKAIKWILKKRGKMHD